MSKLNSYRLFNLLVLFLCASMAYADKYYLCYYFDVKSNSRDAKHTKPVFGWKLTEDKLITKYKLIIPKASYGEFVNLQTQIIEGKLIGMTFEYTYFDSEDEAYLARELTDGWHLVFIKDNLWRLTKIQDIKASKSPDNNGSKIKNEVLQCVEVIEANKHYKYPEKNTYIKRDYMKQPGDTCKGCSVS